MALTLPPSANNLKAFEDLVTALSTSAHRFLQPSSALHNSAILAVKGLFDPLAFDVSHAQEERRKDNGKKRKRSEIKSDGPNQVLQLREVYVDGFGIDQIWEQARRVLDATSTEIERDLQHNVASKPAGPPLVKTNETLQGSVQIMRFDEEGFEVGSDEDIDIADTDEAEEIEDDSKVEEDHDGEFEEEDIEDIEDDSDESSSGKRAQTYQPDPHGLNDGFFSIDDFNKQSQFLEQKDARGEADNPSDEDEIDWDVDPLAMSFSRPKSSKNEDETEELDEDVDEGGATFGNMDLSAPFSDNKGQGEEEEEEDDDDVADLGLADGIRDLDNTNDIKYADFFEPPPKKPSKTKRMRALPKTQPPSRPTSYGSKENIESDIERAISDVRRDLLESDDEDEDEQLSDISDSDSKTSLGRRAPTKVAAASKPSSHEKQRAIIAAEIRRLEVANVSKRDWTLSGEARAADRPVNSLIEEDLDFERIGKPLPVITAEVSEEIESLIKRRILAREFDEVIRRRPEAASSASDARRGRAAINLDDTKPQQGLAEVYEQEHLKRTDPNYIDKRSAAEKREHEKITKLMKEIFRDLDLLTNHYLKPRKPEIEIQVVSDKPTISMEDSRPGAGADGLGEESMLAPQEIYRPGQQRMKGSGEVVRKSGAAVSKEEMTTEEKLRRRRREKERRKKAKGNVAATQVQRQVQRGDKLNAKGRKGKDQGKRDIISELKRGGVQIIGTKGKLEDLSKNDLGKRRAPESVGALKL